MWRDLEAVLEVARAVGAIGEVHGEGQAPGLGIAGRAALSRRAQRRKSFHDMNAGIVPTRVLVDSGACAVAGPGRDGRGSGRTDAQGNDNGSHEQGQWAMQEKTGIGHAAMQLGQYKRHMALPYRSTCREIHTNLVRGHQSGQTSHT